MRHHQFILLSALIIGCNGKDPTISAVQQAEDKSDWDNAGPSIPVAAQNCSDGAYTLKFDSRFSTENIAALFDYWLEWKQILGNHIQEEIKLEDLSNDQGFEPCVIKVISHDPPSGYLGWTIAFLMDDNKPSTARIWLPDDLPGAVDRVVMLHELGHSLSLPHSTDPASIMDPAAYPNSVITCEDKQKLCKTWGCEPGC